MMEKRTCVLSSIQLFVTFWTVSLQALLPMAFLGNILEWDAISSSKGSSQLGD